MATSWKHKLTKETNPRILEIPPSWEKKMGVGTMFIATPKMINDLILCIPRGMLVTQESIREFLALKNHTQITCPLTTGIFCWIAAWANEEMSHESGHVQVPWWRVIKSDGYLNPKFPGRQLLQKERLEREGFTIVPGRKKDSWMVRATANKFYHFE
jgi:hypothetical protein